VAKNRIRELAAQHDETISSLAGKVGMKSAALRRYTRLVDGNQEAQPNAKLAEKLAKALNVSVQDVMGLPRHTPPDIATEYLKIPVFGAHALMSGVINIEDPMDYVDPMQVHKNGKNGYAAYVVDSTMEPRLKVGEMVYTLPGKPAKRGDEVVVHFIKEGCRVAYIKTFERSDKTKVTFSDFSNNDEVTYDSDEIVAIDVVIGNYFM